jgi:hypothetical protein
MFDIGERLDGLRTRPTSWLEDRHAELIREQRRLHVEDLAVLAVLDERGAIDDSIAARDGVSVRSARDAMATARALESLPAVAAAAHAGALSAEQLAPVVTLADETSDAEWARRAPNVAPVDLARMARSRTKPPADVAEQRRQARHLRMWWAPDRGMLMQAAALPDLCGARWEQTITHIAEVMRPPKGERWESFEHRAADALMVLVDSYWARRDDGPATAAPLATLVVEVPLEGPATIAGIPLPDSMVESLRANARVEPVLLEGTRRVAVRGNRRTALSPKIRRAVLLRDGHCRTLGCTARRGLEVHHLLPLSHGGTDDIANLAAVCAVHHRMLVPTGRWALVGNPNRPDGLRLERADRTTSSARAGPAP